MDRREAKTLKVVKDQALITNSNLRTIQLDFLEQVERLWIYQDQGKTLLEKVTQQEEIHAKVEVALQTISHFQKANSIPPPGISKLGKDEMLKYRYTVESWKSEADNVNASLEKVKGLVVGIWNNCSDVIEEWGVGEIEESLEAFMPQKPKT